MSNKEIIQYHNKLNTLRFGVLGELGQNLFFSLLPKIKDKLSQEVIFTADELNSFVKDSNFSNRELFEECNKLKYNLLKLDFNSIRRVGENTLELGYHNMFKSFYLCVDVAEIDANIGKVMKALEIPKNMDFIKFHHLRIQVNEEFHYLINELTSNFTRFELSEFISLSGKYTKTLYRLLKQFRQTGWAIWEWESFKELMDIQYSRQIDIDQYVLKPALRELEATRHLFNQERTIFKNLRITKLSKDKKKCNRGNKVCYVKFEWEKEEVQKDLLIKKLKELSKHEEIPTDLFYKASNYFIEHHLDKKYIVPFSDTNDRACIVHFINPINETYRDGTQEYQLIYDYYILDEKNEIQKKQAMQTYTSLIDLIERLDKKALKQNTKFSKKVKQSKLGEVL